MSTLPLYRVVSFARSLPLRVTRQAVKVNISLPMMRRISAAGEVIEDSEPEREERRRQEKESRKKKKTIKLISQQPPKNNQQSVTNVADPSVIELSGPFWLLWKLFLR